MMWKPASTWTISPVVDWPRSDNSHRAAPATPSMVVSAFMADMVRLTDCKARPPVMPARDRVRMAPAEIELTRIPRGPRSRAA